MAAVAGLAFALALGAPRVAAQATFTWPDTTVDVAKYTTVEECLAAVTRARNGVVYRHSRTAWLDTLPVDVEAPLRAAPAVVTATAARCTARFPVATANLADFALLLPLYLDADRDADANTLVERRMAMLPDTAKAARRAVSDTVFAYYIDARPMRLEAAERLLVARARGATDRLDRMELYFRLMSAANGAGDTARARRAGQWLLAVADSLTPAERESEKWTTMEGVGGNAMTYLALQITIGLRTLLDSLRHSTPAMVNLQRTVWAKLMKERPEALPYPIGEKAPPIQAEYWFPREAGATPRPAPGRVSIIGFTDHRYCLRDNNYGAVGERCGAQIALLRGLSRRFPEIDVTIVDQTHGAFAYVLPQTPAEEAELTRQWIEGYQIPHATIAVEVTPFWKLPSPDGRRIERPSPNFTAYGFGKSWTPQRSEARYLIDQDGIIVDVLFNYQAEPQIIEALLERQRQGGAHATQ